MDRSEWSRWQPLELTSYFPTSQISLIAAKIVLGGEKRGRRVPFEARDNELYAHGNSPRKIRLITSNLS